MTKTKQGLLTIAAISLSFGLTGCGKDNYQGTYTGFEVQGAATTGTTTNQGQYYPNGGYNSVTLTLTNNGDVVAGTYQVTSSMTGTTPTNAAQVSTFQASSQSSGSLSNVSLLKYSTYGGQPCFYQGSLTSGNHGQTLNGTLTAPATSGAITSYCGTLTLSLSRGN